MNVREIIATSAVVRALREASTLPEPVAIEVLGERRGVVYLDGGRITGVDAPGTPDLITRLERSGVQGGDGQAAVIAESVIIDGVQHVIEQVGHSAPEMRIHPRALPPDAGSQHFGLETVIRTACERICRCAQLGIDPDLSLELRPVTRPVMTLNEQQWAVITKIDGRLTARDLAWVTGAELFATVQRVASLVGDGLVRVLQPRLPGTGPTRPALLPAAGRIRFELRPASGGNDTSAIVQQRRGEPAPDRPLPPAIAPPLEWAADLTAEVTVDPELIERLITGLREME